MNDEILERAAHAVEVDAPVTVEALILGVDEQAIEHRVDFLIFHRGAVLLVELAYLLAVGTVDIGCVIGAGLHDVVERRTLAKEPQEIGVHCQQQQQDGDECGAHGIESLHIPWLAGIEALVPSVETLVAGYYRPEYINSPRAFFVS